MPKSIFAYIWKFSVRDQIRILIMTLLSFPFLYLSLDLPKIIINDALDIEKTGSTIFGYEPTKVQYLFILCGIFLLLVLINGGFKYAINVYKGVVGERMLRRLRYELYSRILRFPLPHFRRMSQGESVQMITAEVEPLGGFVGDAFALPAFQGGTLLTILIFMFIQDPVMGLAAVVLYPLQMYLIPKLQREVNQLGKRRVKQVRKIADRIGETVNNVPTIRANDATRYERARFTFELGIIFEIRRKIYDKKFFIKFINNFIAQLGPFFFYAIGGYLVLQGDLTIGALVAVVTAHKELYSPWKELLAYYQLMSDARIKYDQVVTQFQPAGLIDEDRQDRIEIPDVSNEGALRAQGLQLTLDEMPLLDGIGFKARLPRHIGIVGPAGSGKEELALVIANLLDTDRGSLFLGDTKFSDLPMGVTGRHFAYCGYPAQIFSGTVADNLFYGLRQLPQQTTADGSSEDISRLQENERSGNSAYDFCADWHPVTGPISSDDGLTRAVNALHVVGLDQYVYQLGLRNTLPGNRADLRESIMEARRAMRERLDADATLARLVEPFRLDSFNENASVSENLLLAAPIGDEFSEDRLTGHPYMIETLEKANLLPRLQKAGYNIAATMVELFADLPSDHDYFRQFNFIDPDDLDDYKTLIAKLDPDSAQDVTGDERQRLLKLAFKLIPARHRLGIADDDFKQAIVEARMQFRSQLPESLAPFITFFSEDSYNEGASLQENVLFGKIAYGIASAEDKVSDITRTLLEEMGLRNDVIAVGLTSDVGLSGARLPLVQKQKLSLARAIIKDPQIYVFSAVTTSMDSSEEQRLLDSFLAYARDRTVIWVLQNPKDARRFDEIWVMENGKIIETGPTSEILETGPHYRRHAGPDT